MANKTWVRRFAWWRRDENYEDEEGFVRGEVHPEIINRMGFTVRRSTFVPEALDVGARMYSMSAILPNLTAKQLRDLCSNREDLEMMDKQIIFEYEQGHDSNGDPAWIITVGIGTTDEEE
jgi:hypothetical protein